MCLNCMSMIDLNKLEAEIDEVLESETTSSLMKWLSEKRSDNQRKRSGNEKYELSSGSDVISETLVMETNPFKNQ